MHELEGRWSKPHFTTCKLAGWPRASPAPDTPWAQTPARSHLERGSHPLLEDETQPLQGGNWDLGMSQ